MSKLMTAKDFINYNSPCFSCGQKIKLVLAVRHKSYQRSSIKPHPIPGGVEFPLILGYANSLKISINITSNKLSTDNLPKLETYLKNRSLNFISSCSKCKTTIESSDMVFDKANKIVKPLSIVHEILTVKLKNKKYTLINDLEEDKGYYHYHNDNGLEDVIVGHPYPLYKIKTKEDLIKKFKTYMLFS